MRVLYNLDRREEPLELELRALVTSLVKNENVEARLVAWFERCAALALDRDVLFLNRANLSADEQMLQTDLNTSLPKVAAILQNHFESGDGDGIERSSCGAAFLSAFHLMGGATQNKIYIAIGRIAAVAERSLRVPNQRDSDRSVPLPPPRLTGLPMVKATCVLNFLIDTARTNQRVMEEMRGVGRSNDSSAEIMGVYILKSMGFLCGLGRLVASFLEGVADLVLPSARPVAPVVQAGPVVPVVQAVLVPPVVPAAGLVPPLPPAAVVNSDLVAPPDSGCCIG